MPLEGVFSAETVERFGRSVAPYYAGPSHVDVPGTLFALSSFSPEVSRYFFTVLAPRYDLRPATCDLRPRLPEIGVPALVVTGS